MKHAEEQGPWLMVPNQRTGRVEVSVETSDGRERLVGSMPGINPSEDEVREMMRKLEADPAVNGRA